MPKLMSKEKNAFRTLVRFGEYPFSIDHTTSIMCVGSCFAAHMAEKLDQAKFPTLLNPFGIIYHPQAIAKALEDLLKGRQIKPEELFQHQELWHSFDFHSQFSQPDKALALRGMNRSLDEAHVFLRKTKVLIVTLGTARVFLHQKSNRLVSNCHKLPAGDFQRKRLEVNEISDRLEAAFSTLRQQIEDLNIILTVSPVRHIKDGLVENQRSKATLLLAVDQVCKNQETIHYFPSYEMVIDDLRDYRFFESDFIHPNALAIDYIWEHFQNAFFNTKTRELVQRIGKIVQASQHRPFHPNTSAHQNFVHRQLEGIRVIKEQYPHLDFSKEEQHYKMVLAQ